MSANTERDNLASVIIEYLPGADGPADSRTITDAILAEFMPEHDQRVKARAWDQGSLAGWAAAELDNVTGAGVDPRNPYRRAS